jgi:hypothetical protein
MRISLLLFLGFALVAGCKSRSEVELRDHGRRSELRVRRVEEHWEVRSRVRTTAPEDATLESIIRWREPGGREWNPVGRPKPLPAPKAEQTLVLPAEVTPGATVYMELICRDEHGRETFRRRLALVVPPETVREDSTEIYEPY